MGRKEEAKFVVDFHLSHQLPLTFPNFFTSPIFHSASPKQKLWEIFSGALGERRESERAVVKKFVPEGSWREKREREKN